MRRLLQGIVLVGVIAVGGAATGGSADSDVWVREDEIEAALIGVLSPCVVFLSNETNGKYITGTLLKSSGTVVLTNYHILSRTDDTVVAYLNTVQNKVEKFKCEFVKGDRLRDLALLAVTTEGKTPAELVSGGFLAKDSATVEIPYTNKYLSPESFADNGAVKRGYRIAFFGFPLNYGILVDRTNRLVKVPVFRSGRIASEISNEEFLIDAMVSNGNSGSPVFIRSLYKNGANILPGYKFIGIMKEFQHDIIKVKIEGRVVEVPHNTGLGIVIPADAIKDFLARPAQ